jgi:hypothetical protein
VDSWNEQDASEKNNEDRKTRGKNKRSAMHKTQRSMDDVHDEGHG